MFNIGGASAASCKGLHITIILYLLHTHNYLVRMQFLTAKVNTCLISELLLAVHVADFLSTTPIDLWYLFQLIKVAKITYGFMSQHCSLKCVRHFKSITFG